MQEQREQALADRRSAISAKAKRMVWITFRKEGIHMYPAAATDPALKTGDEYDVSFLGTPHRHIFTTIGILNSFNSNDGLRIFIHRVH